MATAQYDVIVVGGGMSGLTAAYQVKKRHPDASVLVLEANDRLGGRTHTQTMEGANGPDKWDLGGQWISRCQTHAWNMAKELNLTTYKQYTEGDNVVQIGGRVSLFPGSMPRLSILSLLEMFFLKSRINSYQRQLDVHDPWSHPRAAEWDAISLQGFIDKNVYTQGIKDLLLCVARILFGGESNQISFLYFLMFCAKAGSFDVLIEDNEDAAQGILIKGGSEATYSALAARIGLDNIKVNEPVESVTQDKEEVTIVTKSGWTGVAARVIFAVPPKAIERIEFTPRLPADRVDFTKRMPMGNYMKAIVTYKKAFWRNKGFKGMACSNGDPLPDGSGQQQPLSLVHDTTSYSGNPALACFVSGRVAVDWIQKSAEDRKQGILAHLAMLFGREAMNNLDFKEKNWNHEPYAHGAPVSFVGVGGMENYSQSNRRVEGRLHFAGTETATTWTGYISGAMQAGERAALEVLSHVKPQVLSEADRQVLEVERKAIEAMKDKNRMKTKRSLSTAYLLAIGMVLLSCAVYFWCYANQKL